MQSSIYVNECEFGLGIFAARPFSRGNFIFRFSGPIITFAECHARGEAECNPLQIGPTIYIDLEPPGVFINHSCQPNAGTRNVVEVYALRDIELGEEIRLDYSTSMSERCWTLRCRCGAASCRGVVTDFHDLPRELQEHYLSLGIVQPFIVSECQIRGRGKRDITAP